MQMGVEKVELDELLARADFITLHMPLTDKTRNILVARGAGQDQEGRPHHQLRPRRPDRRGGAGRGAEVRPCRRRRARRLRRGAGDRQPAVRPAERRLHAAPRRLDHRGAGERRAAGGRADGRLPAHRRRHNALNMPSVTAEEAARHGPVDQAGRASGLLRGPADGRADQGRSTSSMTAASRR